MKVTTLEQRPGGDSPGRGAQLPVGRPAGWFDDPEGTHDQRFFDGVLWTNHVTHFGPKPCPGCGPAV
ncbi:MAG: DUF2510 domain-containing protein [Acidimicrobiales bacterium]|nr:DUF2510 domain-containing protein [Acidimicrobiales bacterium]